MAASQIRTLRNLNIPHQKIIPNNIDGISLHVELISKNNGQSVSVKDSNFQC